MSKAVITESLLTDIADAIREKTGESSAMTPSEMATAIAGISGGGGPLDELSAGTATGNISIGGRKIGGLSFRFQGWPSFNTGVTGLTFPEATQNGGGAAFAILGAVPNLAFVRAPLLTSLQVFSSTSADLSGLTEFSMPKLTKLPNYMCYNCTALTEAYFPAAHGGNMFNASVGQAAFMSCTALATAEIGGNPTGGGTIAGDAFNSCSALSALILRDTTAWTLSNTSALTSTPISAGTGYIYVPRSLVSTYQSATNWTTYSAQFRALEDYTIDGTISGNLDPTKI